MAVTPDGKEAVTHYKVLERFGQYTYVECVLETGRTHQIRVHMAYIGYPLLGDDLYGGDCSRIRAHALHCGYLSLTDPAANEPIFLHTPLRAEMQEILNRKDKTL